MLCWLTAFQEAFVLSHFPAGSRIRFARYMQELTPCPLHVSVLQPGGAEGQVVLRIARNRGGVEREAALFAVLAAQGLPVPEVLAGPVSDPGDIDTGALALYSLLPGNTLQEISAQPGGLEPARMLAIEAISRLHRLTPVMQQHEIGLTLPRKTLSSLLKDLIHSGNPWMNEPVVETAVARLAPVLEAISTPLAFSNGDYQPANFLAVDGQLTGYVDFEKACFEDPLITLARYPVYRLNPLDQAGIVTGFLKEHGFSEGDFAPRLALFCIRTLVTKVPVSGGTPGQQERRVHVLGLLASAISGLTTCSRDDLTFRATG